MWTSKVLLTLVKILSEKSEKGKSRTPKRKFSGLIALALRFPARKPLVLFDIPPAFW
jgi:hypothetical protein